MKNINNFNNLALINDRKKTLEKLEMFPLARVLQSGIR